MTPKDGGLSYSPERYGWVTYSYSSQLELLSILRSGLLMRPLKQNKTHAPLRWYSEQMLVPAYCKQDILYITSWMWTESEAKMERICLASEFGRQKQIHGTGGRKELIFWSGADWLRKWYRERSQPGADLWRGNSFLSLAVDGVYSLLLTFRTFLL